MLSIIAYSNSYIRHAISVMLQQYLGIEAKALYDQIDSKLIASNLLKNKYGRQRRSIKLIALCQMFAIY